MANESALLRVHLFLLFRQFLFSLTLLNRRAIDSYLATAIYAPIAWAEWARFCFHPAQALVICVE